MKVGDLGQFDFPWRDEDAKADAAQYAVTDHLREAMAARQITERQVALAVVATSFVANDVELPYRRQYFSKAAGVIVIVESNLDLVTVFPASPARVAAMSRDKAKRWPTPKDKKS